MAKEKFKYNINHQISLLPREVTIDDIVKVLAKHDVSRDTFYRDKSTPSGGAGSIPVDRLLLYAALFGCTLEDLLHDQPKKIRSIREQLLTPKSKPKFKNQLS